MSSAPPHTDTHSHSSLSSPLVTIDIDDVAADDDQGSPRSRRLTFEFRNFNLFPDVSDGRPSSGLLEKVRRHVSGLACALPYWTEYSSHRPSRSLDIQRVDEEPECAGYLTSPGYSTLGPPSGAYFPYGFTHLTQSPPLLPPPPIQRPSEVTLSHSLISTSPIYSHPHPHPYRPIQSTRPGPTSNPRRNSDVGPAPSLTTQHREKRVVTLREPVPVPIRTAPLAPPPPPRLRPCRPKMTMDLPS
ncbi:hypothetical protein RHS01_03005 [Rhizoctonia solani]|uniref:Uncharacterized protein n=1 Tax=Rhizoctonia solani TaxID=456999 RepID=A0A8H7IK58_9AGAM|nr:hypothetical protein RHS01_03005 [Rhizoctonia solani]